MIKMTLNKLIKDSGLKKNHIAKQLGVSDDTLTHWINSKTYPRLNQAVKLAEILNCKVDDLYERNDKNGNN